jgi:hypothetical protein
MRQQQGWGVMLRTASYRLTSILVDGLIAILRPFGDHGYRISGLALSHYFALSDFAHSLDSLKEKRDWLQSRRRRSDAEILPLFQEPFYIGSSDERYIRFYEWLRRVEGLDGRFASPPD